MRGGNIRNLDIYVPNFDDHIYGLLNKITPEQSELIPSELKFKIFKNGIYVIDKLNFTEKMYLLSVCFKHKIIIATEAPDGGVSAKEFKAAIQAQAGRLKNSELLDEMGVHSLFVQGDKELMQAMQYMAHVKCSDINNLIQAAHPKKVSKRETKYKEYYRALNNLMRMFAHYEGHKKDVIIDFKLSVPKLYALFYFFSGEQFGKDFYGIAFRHAYTSNRADLSGALLELYNDGYLSRRGVRQKLAYTITSKGIELATKVMNKLIFNY
jgi:hypothetical protein